MPNPEGFSMGEEAAKFRVGTKQYLPDGRRVSIVPKPEQSPAPKRKASSVALHETEHAVPAADNGTLIDVTVIPGPGYLGLTRLSRPDPIAAVAPHANGREGTGFDILSVRRMGHHEGSLAGAARSITDAKRDHINAIAPVLDEKGTLSASEVFSIMSEVDRKKKEPKVTEATLFIKEANGKELQIDVKVTKDNVIKFPEKSGVIADFSNKSKDSRRNTLPTQQNSDIFKIAA